MLVKATARCQLGNGRAHDVGIPEQGISRMAGCKDAIELPAHSFACHRVEEGRARGERGRRLGLDHEVEPAGKPHGAEHAKRVLFEAPARLPHRPNHTAAKISRTVVYIEQTARWMPRHRVDREIASGKIVLHALRKANRFRMTPVGVKAVETIRGYLDTLFAPHRRDATEFDARLNNLEAFRLEGGFTLLPGSRAANVHVVAWSASQRVAYPAAHDPRLEPRPLKSTKHLERRCGRRCSVQGRLLDGNARRRAGIDM